MNHPTDYVLGQSAEAARRLEIQDQHFAAPSERLLDELALRPNDRVVELGCGPGGFTRRLVARLGPAGVVVAVDASARLIAQAAAILAGKGPGRVEFVQADVAELGPWIDGADVVAGRAVLHHVPMAEFLLGRLKAVLRPGTRLGFLEPDFRSPLARLAYLEATGHPELAPLREFSRVINELYLAKRISPAVGATLAQTLSTAGYRNVRTAWHEFPTDASVIENMVMIYDETREALEKYGIMSNDQIQEQQRLLRGLLPGPHPAVWGLHQVVCEV
ncbi:MAG TPA: methyltransferase domain-containing protein [Gemmata sp.]|nr:methyltransferase domain-containing protein [Gemmata sp.]